jgi:hypothetical protein
MVTAGDHIPSHKRMLGGLCGGGKMPLRSRENMVVCLAEGFLSIAIYIPKGSYRKMRSRDGKASAGEMVQGGGFRTGGNPHPEPS